MTSGQQLIGTAEVARVLGKSHRTVHRLVEAGRLVPVVVAPGGYNGTFLFDRDAVDEYVKTAGAA